MNVIQIRALEKMGEDAGVPMDWDPPRRGVRDDDRFEETVKLLVAYKKKFGDTDVPYGWALDDYIAESRPDKPAGECDLEIEDDWDGRRTLGLWVSNTRQQYLGTTKYKLPEERVEQLNGIEFRWVSERKVVLKRKDDVWNDNVRRLVAYREDNPDESFGPENKKFYYNSRTHARALVGLGNGVKMQKYRFRHLCINHRVIVREWNISEERITAWLEANPTDGAA